MSLIDLQKKIGTTADGQFGPGTLKAAAAFFKLSPERAAHFFGQCSHETGEFKLFEENLNYSADGLKRIFSKYFPADATALGYSRKPEKIANRVYSNRMGNGNEASGDGWKFRGRGALQTTGKDNYKQLAEHVKNPEILTNPDLVETTYAFEAALFYFDRNGLWKYCDVVDDAHILKVTKAVNGGTNGLDHRNKITKKYYGYFSK
jgi:putative chitinase